MADVQIGSDSANIVAINLVEQSSDPSAPGSGHVVAYIKDGVLYLRGNTGDPTAVGAAPALTENRIGVGDASDLLSALSAGTEGQLLTSHGASAPAWEDPPEGGAGGGDNGNVNLSGIGYQSYTGQAPVPVASLSQFGGGWINQATGAQNDALTYNVYLSAGTWTLRLFYVKNNNSGIYTITLDATTLGTVDGYGPSASYHQISDITGIVVAASGLKALTLTMATKHASSTGYEYYLTSIQLWRTA